MSQLIYPVQFILLIIALQVFSTTAHTQYQLSGVVLDTETNTPLPGASVKIDKAKKFATTDLDGNFSFELPPGEYKVEISFIGFKKIEQKVTLNQNIRLELKMEGEAITTKEAEITDVRADQNTESTKMGQLELKVEDIKKLPAFMGEVDILKAIQLLPGVKSSGEGNAGFYVRGGGPDQNLILLDNAVVYNAAHLFGFFSVFNSDAIKDATLIKGGMPANYGGRLSSVLDISMREGDMKKWHGDGGIGYVAARATFHGPIVKDKLSILVSARRTFVDLFLPLFANDSNGLKGNSYYFLDANAKLTWRVGKKDLITASGYFGRDQFSFRSPNSDLAIDIPWGNGIGSLQWHRYFNPKLKMTTAFTFTDYNFSTKAGSEDFGFELYSGIRDYTLKTEIDWKAWRTHELKFGATYTFHEFTPSTATARFDSTVIQPAAIQKLYAHDFAAYVLDEFNIGKVVKLNVGLRFNYFQHTGPFDRFVKNEFGQTVDTISYGSMDNIADYARLEPRISVRFRLGANSSIKAAYTINYQNMHLANFASISLPTDVWLPSTSLVKPQQAMQGNIGFFQNFLDNMLETSVEVYYKWMKGLVEYKDNSSFSSFINDNPDNILAFGEGRSFGAEFFIKKRLGKWTGWIGYTLSWTQRYNFNKDEINYDGDFFYPRYDRRHDLSLTLSWDINKRWNVSGVFVLSSGNYLAVPSSFYFIGTEIVPQYDDRDNFQMAPYHRLDFSVTYVLNKSDKWSSNLNLSVYNVYSRQNPFFIFFDIKSDTPNNTIQFVGKQVSLFPIIPALTWNFSF